MQNKVRVVIDGRLENVSLVRVLIASFLSKTDITLDELSDIKTAVSEAVTNSIIHGYENKKEGIIKIEASIKNNEVIIKVIDKGLGIKDINKAREPLYTSRPDLERSGMGFTVMETFMDSLDVESEEGIGTIVIMKKKFDLIS